MAATDGIQLDPPTIEDLDAAEKAWRDGTIYHELPSGTPCWRVLRADSAVQALEYAKVCYASDALNRFSPVRTGGVTVLAAYAGTSEELALWEVVLRNIRHSGSKRVPQHETRDRYLVNVQTVRTLKLVDLRRPQISAIVAAGKRPPDLTAAWPSAYDGTRAWAQALFERIPRSDGLLYESHQLPGDCIFLYQPVTPHAFDTLGDAEAIDQGRVRALLIVEAHRAGAAVDFGDDPDPPID